MDEPRAKAVTVAFIQFHKDGLIYRDVRLTNWCCQLRSGISDIEVDYIDIEKRTRLAVPGHAKDKTYVFGVIWCAHQPASHFPAPSLPPSLPLALLSLSRSLSLDPCSLSSAAQCWPTTALPSSTCGVEPLNT